MTCNWCHTVLRVNEPSIAVNQKVFHEACIADWRSYWKELIKANLNLFVRRPD